MLGLGGVGVVARFPHDKDLASFDPREEELIEGLHGSKTFPVNSMSLPSGWDEVSLQGLKSSAVVVDEQRWDSLLGLAMNDNSSTVELFGGGSGGSTWRDLEDETTGGLVLPSAGVADDPIVDPDCVFIFSPETEINKTINYK